MVRDLGSRTPPCLEERTQFVDVLIVLGLGRLEFVGEVISFFLGVEMAGE
jgi:hypothetical protein